MDSYSGLTSAAPVSTKADRIWKTPKKRATQDRREKDGNEERKKNRDHEEDNNDEAVVLQHSDKVELGREPAHDPDKQEESTGSTAGKKDLPKKIDMRI